MASFSETLDYLRQYPGVNSMRLPTWKPDSFVFLRIQNDGVSLVFAGAKTQTLWVPSGKELASAEWQPYNEHGEPALQRNGEIYPAYTMPHKRGLSPDRDPWTVNWHPLQTN